MVLKELILNSFYFQRVWWSWKNWFWTVSTFRGCGGHERTNFEQFLLWEVVMVLKELILNSFYFREVWWSWKNSFWNILLSEGVVVMKELVFNHFYFGRLWWSWKNSFWTISTFRGCGGLERTHFEQFLLSEGAVVGCGGVVVLKELILNSFYFRRLWWSWKNSFWTVSTLRGCGGLDRTGFEQFLLSEGVVVWKNCFWTVSTFRGCGSLERTDFEQFLLSEGLVVLKELILNSFYFQRVW